MHSLETTLPIIKRELADAELDLEYLKIINVNSMSEDAKKDFREEIYRQLLMNIDSKEELKIGDYFGFSILSPSYQPNGEESMFIYLERCGKYYVKIGRSPHVISKRIDDFLLDFNSYVLDLKSRLTSGLEYIENAKKELEKDDAYLEQIKVAEEKLNKIDTKLGVNKGGK